MTLQSFPSPKDRTPNNPSIAVTSFNMRNVAATDGVDIQSQEQYRKWFEKQSKLLGWSSCEWFSAGAVLTADVKLLEPA